MNNRYAVAMVGAVLAGAILVHGYWMQPPRYQLVRQSENIVTRIDTRTGELKMCGIASGGGGFLCPDQSAH
jgi:hypothetical protein